MSRKTSHRYHRRLLTIAVAACFTATPAWALPTGATVANGTATLNLAGNVLNVTNSNGAIIDWQRFGIAAGELTKFIQSSASSSVLNRVVGGNLSAIYGTLSSNGRVWLVNPAGILVGAGGTIDTAAFVASTLAIKNEDFLAGRLTFGGNAGAGNVVNQGTITTPTGGAVYLVGANVSNEGIINSPRGEVILAAGQTVALVDTSTPGVKVEITGAEGNTTNLGTIASEAGRIGMAGVIVRNSGTLNASSAVEEGGKVFLRASQDTYVDGSGRIIVTGTKGGNIEVLGNRVAVMGNASIDASGEQGGGVVRVGGDFQGKNPDVRNAQITYFGPNASIRANAQKVGDGGTVIVWADDTTRAYGNIEARGGADGGNGGFVETSGHRYLDFNAHVDTRAPKGKAGTLLLDPTDITILAGNGSESGGYMGYDYFVPGADSATVYAGTINTTLLSTNVTISTSSGYGGNGDISFASGAAISLGGYTPRQLALLADRDIFMAAGSSISGTTDAPLGVGMTAGRNINTSGGSITTYGGHVEMFATAGTITTGDITTAVIGGSNNNYPSGGHVVMEAGLGVSTGNIDTHGFSQCGDCGGPGAGGYVSILTVSGGIATGNITTTGGDGSWGSGVNGGSVTIHAGNGDISTGSISTRGGDADSGYDSNGGNAGHVAITAVSGNITTGNINTRGGYGYYSGNGGNAGDVTLTALAGTILVSDIYARGGYADDTGTGGRGGDITLRAGGDITVSSNIVTFGGYSNNGSLAGRGGDVDIAGGGNVSIGNIDTRGGDGFSGDGNDAGNVSIVAGGHISTGQIDASGGHGKYAAGNAGDVTLDAATYFDTGYIYARGGNSSDSFETSTGGNGGEVRLTARAGYGYVGGIAANGGNGYAGGGEGGSIVVRTSDYFATEGDVNAFGGDSTLGSGGGGGLVDIVSGGNIGTGNILNYGGIGNNGGDGGIMIVVAGGSVSTGYISARGGNGATDGGAGGSVDITAGTTVGTNSVWVRGGDADYAQGGDGGSMTVVAGSAVSMGSIYALGGEGYTVGGAGGSVDITAGTTISATSISVRGGYNPEDYAQGGDGGRVILHAGTNILVSGGISARGGEYDYNYTSGGHGGSVQMTAGGSIGVTGMIEVQGGYGYSPGGAGDGGSVNLTAGGNISTGTIRGYGGDSDYSVGGNGGSIFIQSTGGTISTGPIHISGGDGAYMGNAGNLTAMAAGAITIPQIYTEGIGGNISLATDGNMGTSATTIIGDPYSLSLYAGGVLAVDGAIALPSTSINLTGAALNVNADVSGLGIALNAPNGGTVTIASGKSVSATVDLGVEAGTLQHYGTLQAGRDVVISAGTTDINGGTISAGRDVLLGATTLTGYGGSISAFNYIDLTVGNATLDGTQVYTDTGDIEVTVTQDLKLNNGARISAGNDVLLTFKGVDSTLYLNEVAGGTASKIVSDTYYPMGTTYIDFLARAVDGIVIDGVTTSSTLSGGSGFYWGASPHMIALPGAGLEITYSQAILDICQLSPELCTPRSPMQTDQEICELNPGNCAPPPPLTGGTGSQLDDSTIGGGEGEFGDDGRNNRAGKRRVGMCRG